MVRYVVISQQRVNNYHELTRLKILDGIEER